MKLAVLKGATSQTVHVFIRNSSTGAPLTGLAYNTASLTAYYVRPRASPAAITLATLASATAAYSSGGFIELDATNMPGWYRLDVPNAVLASGVDHAALTLRGATNMEACNIEFQLTTLDLQTATVVLTDGSFTAAKYAADAISASALSAAAANEIRDAVFANVTESQGSYTFGQICRAIFSVLCGRTSGGTFSTPNGSANRAAYTYSGNDRTGVTLTPDA